MKNFQKILVICALTVGLSLSTPLALTLPGISEVLDNWRDYVTAFKEPSPPKDKGFDHKEPSPPKDKGFDHAENSLGVAYEYELSWNAPPDNSGALKINSKDTEQRNTDAQAKLDLPARAEH